MTTSTSPQSRGYRPRRPGVAGSNAGRLASVPAPAPAPAKRRGTVGDDDRHDNAAEAAPAPATSGEAEGAPVREATERRGRRWPLVLLALIAALGVAGSVTFGLAWSNDRSTAAASSAVADTTRDFVIALTNFDPGTVPADFSHVESFACCQFATQAKSYFSTSVSHQLATAHAASRGKLADLYVQSVSAGSASVFAVVDQTYLNAYASSPVNDTLRLVVDLTNRSGVWKVSSVQVLQQPVSSNSSSSTTPKP